MSSRIDQKTLKQPGPYEIWWNIKFPPSDFFLKTLGSLKSDIEAASDFSAVDLTKDSAQKVRYFWQMTR